SITRALPVAATSRSARPIVVGAWFAGGSAASNANVPSHATVAPSGRASSTRHAADAPRSGTRPESVIAPGRLPTVPGAAALRSSTDNRRSASGTPQTVTLTPLANPLPDTLSSVPTPPRTGDTSVTVSAAGWVQAARSRRRPAKRTGRRLTPHPRARRRTLA